MTKTTAFQIRNNVVYVSENLVNKKWISKKYTELKKSIVKLINYLINFCELSATSI